jgi:hypothetical protein
MQLFIMAIVVTVVALAAFQLVLHGWSSFVYRPPGTGASK